MEIWGLQRNAWYQRLSDKKVLWQFSSTQIDPPLIGAIAAFPTGIIRFKKREKSLLQQRSRSHRIRTWRGDDRSDLEGKR